MLLDIENTVIALVCLVTAVVIQRIYLKEQKHGKDTASINGIKWFGLAIFVWGLGAFFTEVLLKIGFSETHKAIIYLGLLVSLLNSLFIILSLPSIEHNQSRSMVVKMINRFTEKEFIGLYSGILVMIAFVFLITSLTNDESSNRLIWLIDIPISLVVAFSLLMELNRAFKHREMRFMYLPSFALFILIVIAVSHRIIPLETIIEWVSADTWKLLGSIAAISFKFLFIVLFSILLYSWKFLSEKEQQQSMVNDLIIQNKELLSVNNELLRQKKINNKKLSVVRKELEAIRKSKNVELSDRQKEVLGNLAVMGMKKSYTDIAEAMNISVDGFQTHIYQIKKILNVSGVDGKEQLINFATKNNLIHFATIKSDG